jgi:hypothetical protein
MIDKSPEVSFVTYTPCAGVATADGAGAGAVAESLSVVAGGVPHAETRTAINGASARLLLLMVGLMSGKSLRLQEYLFR